MTPPRDRTHRPLAPPIPERQPPLSNRRFEDLLQQASAFFAQAERDPEAVRRETIAEIVDTMKRYGLTVEDLRATR